MLQTGQKATAMRRIHDEELEHLAAKRGRCSAEAFLILELREARSTGRRVAAYRDGRGRYSVRSAPENPGGAGDGPL